MRKKTNRKNEFERTKIFHSCSSIYIISTSFAMFLSFIKCRIHLYPLTWTILFVSWRKITKKIRRKCLSFHNFSFILSFSPTSIKSEHHDQWITNSICFRQLTQDISSRLFSYSLSKFISLIFCSITHNIKHSRRKSVWI